jgi:large repetitive protein
MLALLLSFGLFAPESASAAGQLKVLVDFDNNPATGCTISTPAGPFAGADEVVTTTIDPVSGQVTGLQLQLCSGGTLGAPIALTSPAPPWPVGHGNGTLGSDVVETYFPRLSASGTTLRLGFVYDNGTGGVSALLTTTGLPNGPPILVTVDSAAAAIPALGPLGFAVLAILLLLTGAIFARRRGMRTGVWVLLALMAGVGLVWAAVVFDGQIGDWAGVPPVATGPGDLKAAFTQTDNANVDVRVDGAFLGPGCKVNPTAVPGGTVNVPYGPVNFTLTGGVAPITWSFTGTLPAGLSLSASGVLSGTPTQTGSFPITVTGTDANGCRASQAVTVVIALTNPPVANSQSVTTDQDVAKAITLSASDPDSPSLTFSIGTGPSHGSLGPIGAPTCTPAGSGSTCTAGVTYTPSPGYNGPDSFTFSASDGTLSSALATVSITVNPVGPGGNHTPVVNGATFMVAENSPNGTSVGTVTATDPDPGQTLTFSLTGGNTGGAFAINASTGQLTVANSAALDFETTPTFSLTVQALDNGSPPLAGTGTVTVNLTDVNEPPVVTPATFTIPENSPNGTSVGTVTATDPDAGQTKTFSITAGNTGGAFTINASTGQITVATSAAVNFETNPTFSLTVQVMDNGAPPLSGTATITVNLTDVNEAPVVNPATFTLPENSPNGTTVGTVTATDPDAGQTKTFSITAGNTGGAFAINASTGQLTVANSAALDFETTPTFGLTVQVTDNGVPPLSGTATITVNLTNVNDPPVAASQTTSTNEDTAKLITLSGSDQDSTTLAPPPLTFTIVSPPAHGGLSAVVPDTPCTSTPPGVTCTAKVTYTPNANFNGTDSFTFKVNDGSLDSTAATVTINIGAVADLPVANNQTTSTPEDTLKTVTLSGIDVDGHNLTFSIVTGSANGGLLSAISGTTCQPPDVNGAVTCTANVDYTPASNFTSPPDDTFTFKVNNTVADSAPGTVTITVTSVNDPPVAADKPGITTPEDTAKVITLSATDVDTTAPALTFSVVLGPTGGSLSAIPPATCVPAGSGQSCTADVTYTPTANVNGADSFTYKANDGASDSNTATVSITVGPVNDAPTATPQSGLTTPEATALPITLAGTDVETAPANLTFLVTVNPLHGSVTGTPPNVTYTPSANYVGPDSFQFTATDRGDPDNCGAPSATCAAPLTSAAATISITVTCPTITVNGTIPDLFLNQVMATATFTQAGSPGTITWSQTGLPPGVNINSSTGDVTGTPTASGSFSVTITATDGAGCSGAKMLTVLVKAPPGINSANSYTKQIATALSFMVTTTGPPTGGFPTAAITQAPTGGQTGFPGTVTFSDNGNGTASLGGSVNTGGAQTYTTTITANNGVNPPATQAFSLIITCPAITVTRNGGGSFPAGMFNVAYNGESVTASGGSGSYTFAVATGSLPTNLSLASNGTISSGPPSQTGTFLFTVTATDSTGCTGTSAQLSIEIKPVAGPDTYNDLVNNTEAVVTGGTTTSPSTPFVPLSGFVIANDTPLGGVTAVAATVTTTQNGSVAIAADGSFKYTPPVTVSALASDTFTYTISSNTGGTATPATATGTVTLNLANRVWYVDPNLGVNGNGQSQSPWNSTANIKQQPTVGGANTGDILFIYSGPAGNLTANVPLLQNQTLHGEGQALVVNSVTLRNAGTKPSLTASAANVVSVNSGNTIKGLTLTGTTNALITGSPAGLTVTDVNVNPSGTAMGFNITGGSGTVALSTVTMTGTGTGDMVKVNTGTQSWTFTSSPISQSGGGRALNVTNKTQNGMTFDAASTVTVTSGSVDGAITLSSNTGTGNTFAFNKIALTTTGTARGLVASSTGTLNITDGTSTVAVGSGTAVDLASTALNVTLHSVSGNGAGTGATGMSLSSTTGSFTVNGTASTAGSGGTVQNYTSRGISVVSSPNVTLKNMNFTGNGTAGTGVVAANCADALNQSISGIPAGCQANVYLDSATTVVLNNVKANQSKAIGILGHAVNGLTLTNVEAQQNGDEVFEDGVQLVNQIGTVTVTGGTFKDNAARSFEVQNNTGSPTVNISGATMGNTNNPLNSGTTPTTATAADTLLLATNGSNGITMTSVITGSTFSKIYGRAINVNTEGNTNQNVTFGQTGAGNGNTVSQVSYGTDINGTTSGNVTYSIVNNTFTTVSGAVTAGTRTLINARMGFGATGTWSGTVSQNTIGTNGVTDSGCDTITCGGISLDNPATSGQHDMVVTNNTIYRVNGHGIFVANNAGAAPSTGLVRARIEHNTLADPEDGTSGAGGNQGSGIFVASTTDGTINVKAGGSVAGEKNDVTGNWGTQGGGTLRGVRFSRGGGTVFCISGYSGPFDSTSVGTFITTQNTGNAGSATQSLVDGAQFTGPTCPTP